jgi:hypothetical protein
MSLCKHLIVLAIALTVAWGCGGAALSSGTAQLRAISAIDSPALIDVFTDIGPVATNLGVGQVSSFSFHPAQVLGVTVRQAGSSTSIVSGSLNLGSNQRYTLFPYRTGSSTYDMIALVHNAGTPPAGKFRLRAVHLDRFVAAVDVYFAPVGANLSLETPIVQNLAFETTSPYIQLDANVARQITFTQAGTTNPVGDPISVTAGSATAKTALLYDDGGDASGLYSD